MSGLIGTLFLTDFVLSAALLQYVPENFTPDGIRNTGAGGSAYDLYRPAGVPAPELRVSSGAPGEPPAGSVYLRFPPGSYFRTYASLPASVCGQSPRTACLLTRVGGSTDGALCSYGVGQPGQASDLWVNGGAGGIFCAHTYGASASLHDVAPHTWVGLLARQEQRPGGWSVQNGHAPSPEPLLSTPVVDTQSTPFYLGCGTYGVRDYYFDFFRYELREECFDDLEATIYAAKILQLTSISL